MAYKSCPHCIGGIYTNMSGKHRCGVCGGTGMVWTPDPIPSGPRPVGQSAPRQINPRFVRVEYKGIDSWEGPKRLFFYPHGVGKAVLKSGVLYDGAIRWGHLHGEGVLDAGGYQITGKFRRDCPHGDCVVTIPTEGEGAGEFRFECRFKTSWPKGKGVLIFPDSSRFEGKWNGHNHADGTYTDTDGTTSKAMIRDGKIKLKKGFFNKPQFGYFSTLEIFTGKEGVNYAG